jgi:protein-tyrosine-phosphatase
VLSDQRRSLELRAARHAALGEPLRLSIVDDLVASDRSPSELARRLDIGTNLLAHHLDALAEVGIVTRTPSAGDGRRRYVSLQRAALSDLRLRPTRPRGPMVFLCTHNSARSQLAAALWTARTGRPASSAGTHPAAHVHHSAVAAARRAGLDLAEATPRLIGRIARSAQVVTVCDLVHEELEPAAHWWHWSIPDPVARNTAAAFDAVVAELEHRIDHLVAHEGAHP